MGHRVPKGNGLPILWDPRRNQPKGEEDQVRGEAEANVRTLFARTITAMAALCASKPMYRGKGMPRVSRRRVGCQANKDGADLNLETVSKAWKERPDWLRPPPIVTAATLPVIALSLLSKTITGHGLPGTLLGTVEGLSYLALPLGFEALAPRLKTFFTNKDLSYESLLQCLTEEREDKRPGDTMSARERIALLRPDPK